MTPKTSRDNYWQVWNINWSNVVFTSTAAESNNNWTLSIALWESNVKTVFLSWYVYRWTFNSPNWSSKKKYFSGYFKLTNSSVIDFNPIVNINVDSSENAHPQTKTAVENVHIVFNIDTGASKITTSLVTSDAVWTSSITWIYIDWTDLKIDYVLDWITWADDEATGVFIWVITIIN